MEFVNAYHIVWTTYGTWLPGDSRGWIKRKTIGIQAPDPEVEQQARENMAAEAVVLSSEQRRIVETTIRKHCEIRKWDLHAVNVRSNHVHVVVSADRPAEEVMNQLKAWCSRTLSDTQGLKSVIAKRAGRKRWFTEGGDKLSIDTAEYLSNAIQYVQDGQ